MQAPFFGAFHALTVDDSSSRTGFPPGLFATLLIKRVWIRSSNGSLRDNPFYWNLHMTLWRA